MTQVLAPTPGIFWYRPDPESPVSATPGQRIGPGDLIGVIEVMKMFFQLESEVSGVFVRYLVEDGQMVELGAPVAELTEAE